MAKYWISPVLNNLLGLTRGIDMKSSAAVLVLVASAMVAGTAGAHHSDAMFEREKVLELSGTVKEFQFTNPHTWIQVDVKDEKGELTEWSLEWGSPNQLGRQG